MTTTLALALMACACGGSDNDNPSGTDGGMDPGNPDAGNVDETGIAFRTLLTGFDPFRGFYHELSGRLFSLPDALSSSLQNVTVATFDGDEVEVESLAVVGDVPTGRIESLAYAPALDRFVAIVRAQNPHRIEIATVALGPSDANFTILSQPVSPEADGYQFGDMYPLGGANLVVERGNDVLAVTLSDTEASWGTAQPGHFYRGTGSPVAFDEPRGRLVGFGLEVYDPESMTFGFEPSVGTLPLSGPYAWTEQSLGGAPDDPGEQGWIEMWAAWDATEQRLLTVVPVEDDCGGELCWISSLWEANLQTGQWTQLLDYFTPPGFESPFAVDNESRRILGHEDGQLWAMTMAEESPMATIDLEQVGDIGPNFVAAATVLSSGKILSSDGGVFRVLDPAASTPRWEVFGSQRLGSQRRYRPSFTEDPTSGEILVYGGASSNASPASAQLLVLSADGESFEEVETGEGPGGRTAHGAALMGEQLIVVGGYDEVGMFNDEVWSLDRQASEWSMVAQLPQPMTGVSLLAVSDREILALGRYGADYAIAVVSIDLSSGATETLKVEGAEPERLWSAAPYGSCFAGFESGDTVDATQPQGWRCVRTETGIRWESEPIDASDYELGGWTSLLGVGGSEGLRTYFVGRNLLVVESD